MKPENVIVFVNPRKGCELTGEHNCSFCSTFHTRLAQLPGTDQLIGENSAADPFLQVGEDVNCKSCATAPVDAINASYQVEFRASTQREPGARQHP
jgi:hypothetical protein